MDARIPDTTRVAVVGATGRLGSNVAQVLRRHGHEVVELSRASGVDVVSGAGLSKALAGVDVIIDTSSTPSVDQAEATRFFTASAHNLHEIGEQAGVQRVVAASIIGIDTATGGYSAAKLVHERELLTGPLPVRILRAAQFHEFVETLLRWGIRDGIARIPVMRTQLVAAHTVAEHLVRTALEPMPTDVLIPQIAGPREERLAEVAAQLATRLGLDIRVEEYSDPDSPERALYEDGGLLPGPGAILDGPTFTEWLTIRRALDAPANAQG